MRSVIFDGTVAEFDALYWHLMQGFEQYLAGVDHVSPKAARVRVLNFRGETVCTRWII